MIWHLLNKNVFAKYLHIANTDPPHGSLGVSFYNMKTRILESYGERVGYDIQHIVHYCYRCGGTGEDPDYGTMADPCPCEKCGGSGKWREFWVLLAKYRFGAYSFHLPQDRRDCESGMLRWVEELGEQISEERIDGLVTHKKYDGREVAEAGLRLSLVFNWGLFKSFCQYYAYGVAGDRGMGLLTWLVVRWRKTRSWRQRIKERRWARFEKNAAQDNDLPF